MLNGMTFNTSSVVKPDERQLPVYNNSINLDENPFRATNNNFRATNRGFSANRAKQNNQGIVNNKPFKDPDIWDSPPAIEKRQSVQKVNKGNPIVMSNNKNHQIRNLPPKKKG